jgi:hypothetical protein
MYPPVFILDASPLHPVGEPVTKGLGVVNTRTVLGPVIFVKVRQMSKNVSVVANLDNRLRIKYFEFK